EIQSLEEAARRRLKVENPDLQPTPKDLVQALTDEERSQHEKRSAELDALKKSVKPVELPQGRTVLERISNLTPSHLMVRGDFRRKGPEILAAFPRIANADAGAVAAPSAGATSSGRRTQLARWIASPGNSLAMRAIANRLWQYHFGRGL